MPQTPRRRRTAPVGALVPALLVPALLTLLLTGCMADPAEIPGDAQEPSATAPADGGADGTAPSAAPDDSESTDVGAAVARRITDCLARYGLSERPVVPDDVSEEELVAARRLIEQYDQTFTTCTAEALAASATAP
ncbi:hypothetical protein MT349_11115 [Rathayibacter caricis]|uniref:hypothetical protein n=1 Tax=Rathayibacter caricis TaxID=110936 RepID=UPI001FB26C45|nr:hypothetical protein [Rathayibacter caricis]MCJ1696332.1 hypothetical protein [Rathayibacter caricis]